MNYIKHLTGFFDKVAKDRALNPTHVSLYMSLFQFWNYNRFKNPISISRDEIMRISKISSKATYHKCLKALHSQGYIKYEPSYNPFKGSHVFLFNFSEDLKPLQKNSSSNFKPVDEQVVDKSCTGSETSTEQVNEIALVPSINYTNNTNSKDDVNIENLGEPTEKNENEIQFLKNHNDIKEEKSSAKKEEKNIPQYEDVLVFFSEHSFPELEANKFYNYFKSNGWLVGGKTPMADWQAAAKNWMLNIPKFINHGRADSAKQFDTSANKDYSEPL
jgi:hypothetical protein